MSDLKNQVMDGLKWSVLAKVLTQGFSWISTFLVIRMLTPEDYGVIAIVMVLFSLISLFTTNGLTSALVKHQKRDKKLSSQMFTLSVIVNLVLSSAVALLAPYIADYYQNQDLILAFYVLCFVNPITSLFVVGSAHLQMEMKFKEKAFVETASGLTGALIAFILAYMGFAYWSLIIANIMIMIIRAIGTQYYAKSEFSITTDFSGAIVPVKFALNMQVGSIVWFLYNKADTIIVGKLLGLERLGFYNVASEIASIPMTKVSAILNDVAFAAFSKTNDDIDAAKSYLKKSLRIMGVISFPVFFGLSAVSNELVFIALGEKWMDAALLISILSIILPLRMFSSVLTNFANAMGESKFNLHNVIVIATILIVSIYVGAQYSLKGVAVAWVLGFAVAYLFIVVRFRVKFSIPIGTLFIFLPVMMASALMWLVVFYAENLLLPSIGLSLNVYSLFIFKVTVGAVSLTPFLCLAYGKEIIGLLKR